MLRQSLINLVDNAIKYTPAGGAHPDSRRRHAVGPSLDVSDTGPGIAPEVRTRIFDRYDRGGDSPADDIGGSGLGLAIAKWAVEVNGGQLSLESTTGTGSTFRITLPRPGRTWDPASGSARCGQRHRGPAEIGSDLRKAVRDSRDETPRRARRIPQ